MCTAQSGGHACTPMLLQVCVGIHPVYTVIVRNGSLLSETCSKVVNVNCETYVLALRVPID